MMAFFLVGSFSKRMALEKFSAALSRFLDLTQHEDLPGLRRQGGQRGRDLPSPVTGLGALLRVGPIGWPILDLLDRTLGGALAGAQVGP